MDDARWMASALVLARRALGRTWPNPAVGCIIVKNDRVVGRGITAPGGRPHAETQALAQAGAHARGATAYVTLEPCSHHGKTPPCTEALIGAGISRAVIAIQDPDPRVCGRGIAGLKANGVAVSVGVLEDHARNINAGFLSRIETGRPHLTLKLATTVDGRIATRTGESRWITGPSARRYVHLMRAEADAVLIGAGTARTDDPMLDVRGIGLEHQNPVRVIADGALSVPLTGKLARTAKQIPLWILHRDDVEAARAKALIELGAELIPTSAPDGTLDMRSALHELAKRGLTRILCEGGGRIAASLLAADLVDEVSVFWAGKVIGGDGTPAIQAFGLETLADAPGFCLARTHSIGPDVLSRWVRRSSAA